MKGFDLKAKLHGNRNHLKELGPVKEAHSKIQVALGMSSLSLNYLI